MAYGPRNSQGEATPETLEEDSNNELSVIHLADYLDKMDCQTRQYQSLHIVPVEVEDSQIAVAKHPRTQIFGPPTSVCRFPLAGRCSDIHLSGRS